VQVGHFDHREHDGKQVEGLQEKSPAHGKGSEQHD
jgi:hypothetical protein